MDIHSMPDQTMNICTVTKYGFVFDNRWIVPHNPLLIVEYDCHINVEICITVKSVGYIHKYIYKGYDGAILHMESNDEVTQYTEGCYIFSVETC
jgi:hypothetical protein